MPNTLVIDLSHHNVIPQSLMPARDAGVRGIIHKATEDTNFTDSKLAARSNLANVAGLLWGMYHFIRPGNITEQAEHFLRVATPYIDPNTLVALDYEDAGVSLADCRNWIDVIQRRTSRSVVFYSGHVLKDAIKAGQDPDWLVRCRLWLADYTPPDDLPPGWSRYWLWQWSDKGHVPGIEPPTDVNDFQDGIDALEEQWSGAFSTPEPVPQRPSILIDIAADAEVQVKVIVNGVAVT